MTATNRLSSAIPTSDRTSGITRLYVPTRGDEHPRAWTISCQGRGSDSYVFVLGRGRRRPPVWRNVSREGVSLPATLLSLVNPSLGARE